MARMICLALLLLTPAAYAQVQTETVCTPENTEYYYFRAHENPITSDGLATYRELGFPNEKVTCAIDDNSTSSKWASRRQIQVRFILGQTPLLVTFDETVVRVRVGTTMTDISNHDNRMGIGVNFLECKPPKGVSEQLECILTPEDLGKVKVALNAPRRDATDLAIVVDYSVKNSDRLPEGKMTWGAQTLPLVRVGLLTEAQQTEHKTKLGQLYESDALILTSPYSNQALTLATKYPGFVIHVSTGYAYEAIEAYPHLFEEYNKYPVPSQNIIVGNMIVENLAKAYEIGG